MSEAKVKKGSALIDIMTEHSLAQSKAEARRLIEQGGVRMNDAVIDSVDDAIEAEGILKVGKRKFLKLIF